jgi:hypothetical protein
MCLLWLPYLKKQLILKKTLLPFIFLAFVLNAFSQDLHPNYSHIFSPGYSFGVNAGLNMYVAEGNEFYLNKPNTVFSLAQNGGSIGRFLVGYDYTPVIGIRGFMGIAQHDWPDVRFKNPDGTIRVVSFGSEQLTADVMVNLSNWFNGYDPTRFVNISAFAGLGLGHRDKANFPTDLISGIGRAGIQGDFPLSHELNLNVIAENNVVSDNFNGYVIGTPFEFYMAFTVGLTYRIQ